MAGYERRSSSGQIASGAPIVVYGLNVISITDGVVNLRNGATATDPIVIQQTSAASQGTYFDYGPYGVVFPNGCYSEQDINTADSIVVFEKL